MWGLCVVGSIELCGGKECGKIWVKLGACGRIFGRQFWFRHMDLCARGFANKMGIRVIAMGLLGNCAKRFYIFLAYATAEAKLVTVWAYTAYFYLCNCFYRYVYMYICTADYDNLRRVHGCVLYMLESLQTIGY